MGQWRHFRCAHPGLRWILPYLKRCPGCSANPLESFTLPPYPGAVNKQFSADVIIYKGQRGIGAKIPTASAHLNRFEPELHRSATFTHHQPLPIRPPHSPSPLERPGKRREKGGGGMLTSALSKSIVAGEQTHPSWSTEARGNRRYLPKLSPSIPASPLHDLRRAAAHPPEAPASPPTPPSGSLYLIPKLWAQRRTCSQGQVSADLGLIESPGSPEPNHISNRRRSPLLHRRKLSGRAPPPITLK